MSARKRIVGATANGRYSQVAAWRMGIVVSGSVAILVALPGWLRALEQAPRLEIVDAVPGTSVSVVDSRASAQLPAAAGDVARYDVLADFLAKRYKVSSEAVERFINLAHSAGHMTKLDPLLLLAMMAVESSFNPIAESVMGAKGLMQVIPHYHQDKLRTPQGGELNVLDPETNILVGAKVLREYASRTGNDLAAALGLYGGTGPAPDNPYASKVFTERQRLEQILRLTPRRTAVERAVDAKHRT